VLNLAFLPGFWLALALVPLVLFYFLRQRFRRQPLGSAYLWRRLAARTSGGRTLRFKSILMLILQVLAVLCLMAGLVEPRIVWPAADRPGTVFLVDGSASMACRNDGQGVTRWQAALERLKTELAALPPDHAVAVFRCAGRAQALETEAGQARIWSAAEASSILARLAGVGPGWDAFREEAVVEDLRTWLAGRGSGWRAVLIGDGGSDLGGSRLGGLFGDSLRAEYVGGPARDIGLASAWLDGSGGTLLACRLVNSTGREQTVGVALFRDRILVARSGFRLDPGQSRQDLVLSSSLAPGRYRLELEANPAAGGGGNDDFPADDRLELAVNQPRLCRILHAGPDNPFLRAAFTGPEFSYSTVDALPADGLGDWDLVVSELAELPAGLDCRLLSFGALPADAPASFGTPVGGQLDGTGHPHPLGRFVDWQSIRVRGGRALLAGPGARVLAECGGQPVGLAWENRGFRQAAFGFGLADSDLVLAGGFPVFLRNLVQWCVPQAANPLADNLRVGEPVLRAEGRDWRAPGDGLAVERLPGGLVRVGGLSPGAWPWVSDTDKGWLAVRLPESELELQPRTLPALGPTARDRPSDRPSTAVPDWIIRHQTGLAGWFLAAAFGLLALEWLLWQGAAGWRRKP
jgi:hypothetical protein